MSNDAAQGWWRRLLERLFRRQSSTETESTSSSGGSMRNQGQQPGQSRYSVHSGDASSSQVADADTLAEAHKQWQDMTDQEGTIIDTQTGEDVTPEPDDNGRYVVLDQDDSQKGSYNQIAKAENAWDELTGQKGRIVDIKTGKEVTPRTKSYLSTEQIQQAVGLSRGASKLFSSVSLTVSPELVAQMIEEINRLPLPVFDVTNIAGKGKPKPTKTVPITRRRVTIQTVRRIVEVESTGKPQPNGRIPVVQPTDDVDMDRIRSVSDLSKVSARQLAVPPELLGRRVVKRELTRPSYWEEVSGPAPIQKHKVWQEFEEPQVEEWTENVEVSEEPQSQLLECVVDVSGSMDSNYGINLAVALMCVLTAKHMDDGSRYLFRPFATIVGSLKTAETEADKQKLGQYFMVTLVKDDLGGGTNILDAITVAAKDVRSVASGDDRPEVLLLTDGDDTLSPADVYHAVGEDVTLHTVITGGFTNNSLKDHSSTYYELNFWSGQVASGTGRTPYVDDW